MTPDEFRKTEEYRRAEMATHALLSEYAKIPSLLHGGLPNPNNFERGLIVASKIISGEGINGNIPSVLWPKSSDSLDATLFSELSSKISDDIEAIFKPRGLSNVNNTKEDFTWNVLSSILLNSMIFTLYNVTGAPEVYQYNSGKKEEYEKKVEDFFCDKELNDFRKIGSILSSNFESLYKIPYFN